MIDPGRPRRSDRARAPESAASPVESSPEFARSDGPDAPPPFRDADGIGAARAEAFENAGEAVAPILSFQQPMLLTPGRPTLHLRCKNLEFAPAPTEAERPRRPAAETAPPDLTERAAASDPQPSPPERTAAIYVLRHPSAAATSNIVPIRPGALEFAGPEIAPSFPAESVELSRSERDAFREIARALVGRAPLRATVSG